MGRSFTIEMRLGRGCAGEVPVQCPVFEIVHRQAILEPTEEIRPCESIALRNICTPVSSLFVARSPIRTLAAKVSQWLDETQPLV